MQVYIILISGILATGLMTLFDYGITHVTKRRFIVPEILNILLSRAFSESFTGGMKNAAGWVVHFAVGVIFAVIFYLVLLITDIRPGLLFGAVMGFLFGLLGIAGWRLLFKLHKNPPEINLKRFLLQLLAAHIVFGTGLAVAYLI